MGKQKRWQNNVGSKTGSYYLLMEDLELMVEPVYCWNYFQKDRKKIYMYIYIYIYTYIHT